MNSLATDQIESHENPAHKKSHFWKWFWVVTLVLIVLMFWAVGRQFQSVPLRISKETTFVTGPLTPDGKSVDFLKAFEAEHYSDKIATDENGYRLFVQRFGASYEIPADSVDELYRKLGLTKNSVLADLSIVEPFDQMKAYCQSPKFDVEFVRALDAKMAGKLPTDQPFATKTYNESDAEMILESRTAFPWTLDDLPMMSDWVAGNSHSIPVIIEALTKPSYEIPLVRIRPAEPLCEVNLFGPSRMRTIARMLLADANYQLGVGNIDRVIDNVVACIRLGRLLQNQFSVLDLLAGIAIEGIGHEIGYSSSAEHQPSKKQLERLQREIASIPARAGFDNVLPFERLWMLSLIQGYSQNGVSEFDKQILPSSRYGINWNTVALRINQVYDNPQLLEEYFAYIEPVDLWLIGRRSRMVADDLLLPYSVVAEAKFRIQCARNLHQITLAMLLYEKEHGTLPPAYSVDENGIQLHSWRALILPYLGQQELYDQLKLNEPWDSVHNKKFWNADVPFYQCPSDVNSKPGQANYSVVVGAESAFDGVVGKRLDEFGPNSASLILVVERLDEVCWLDPSKEIPLAIAEQGVDGKDKTTRKFIGGIASEHPAGAQAGRRDGKVQFLVEEMNANSLKKMLRGEFRRRIK